MIRVLQSVSNMDRAGIETMLMNYYRHIDRTKVQFDFIVNKPKPGDYDDEIRKMGGRIYPSPSLNPLRYVEYINFVRHIVKSDSNIKIVHAHNEAMGLYALRGAKYAGIKVRIAHAHNTRIVKDYKWPLKMFCKQFLAASATDLWSCGRDAGIYFFGKKNWEQRGMVLHNAIETERFCFDAETRRKMRAQYGLENKTVIGHVGRFNVQKNHARLLDIFACYLKKDPTAMLVLVGKGELQHEIREKAERMGIEDHVIFAGLQSYVNRWYQMMDLFLLPSLFEGLPVVGVEAQASGLSCLFSDGVPDEVLLSDRAVCFPLSASNEMWAEQIEEMLAQPYDRAKGAEIVREAGYDIDIEAQRLQEMYLTMSER